MDQNSGKPNLSNEQLKQLNFFCPVCKDQNLWSTDEKAEKIAYCLNCGGCSTTVEVLQLLSGKLIFSEKMFVFRSGQAETIVCRFCSESQSSKNKLCIKCGQEVMRTHCVSCKARMSEYSSNGLVIERCQMCNKVWLDAGKFEQVMKSTPDLQRQYDEAMRRAELWQLSGNSSANPNHTIHEQPLLEKRNFWALMLEGSAGALVTAADKLPIYPYPYRSGDQE